VNLAQNSGGYRYNSDTLALYDFIASELKPYARGEILDVGCGCGILGLLLKRDFAGLNLNLLDISQESIKISQHNSLRNNLAANVICADFREFKSELKFDLIVSNPPFYNDGVQKSKNESIALSRYASALSLREFARCANANVASGGELYFCYEAISLSELVLVLNEFKFAPVCIKFLHSKEDKSAKLVLVKAKKNFRGKCKILPPLIMHKNGAFSSEAERIFARAATRSYDWSERCGA